MAFPDDCQVIVKQEDDRNWLTKAVIKYTAKIESFEVPIDSPTDFASIPRVFVWFLPRYGRYTKAAILHDFLWRNRDKAEPPMEWRDADGIFRRAMRDEGVPYLRRWIMWSAVRYAALKNRDAWTEPRLLLDLPRMLIFTVLATPIVLPPAAVILVALLVWLLVEALFWLPLKAVELVKSELFPDVRRKKVNAPTLGWKV